MSSGNGQRPDVSIVTVTYNSRQLIRRCLESVHAGAEGITHEVIIVDNASSDRTVETVRSEYPNASIVSNGANEGFAFACNQGAAAGSGRYLLFLNPDTELGPCALAQLCAHLDSNPKAAVVAPQLVYPDGRLQHSLRNFPDVGNQLFEAVSLHRLAPRLTSRFGEVVTDPRFYQRTGSVDWVSGAAMLVRRTAFDAVRGFDERFFLYSEEMDLCRCLRSEGWTVDYLVGPVVVHHHGDTTRPELFRLQLTSRLLYFDKHFSGARLAALRFVTALGLALRMPVWAIREAAGEAGAAARFRSHADGVSIVLHGSERAASR